MKVDIVYEGKLSFYKREDGMYFISPKKKEGLIQTEMKYHIIRDEESDQFAATSITEDGPSHIILSGKNIDELKEKFKEAFYMSCVVGSIINLCDPDELQKALENKKES